MAQYTTYYNLIKPEASDPYNHLVNDNPNMDTIDTAMKNNSNHGVDTASCIKSGTVHSVTRTNTSCPVFKFTATGDWNTGDTMDVDGTPVSVFLPNGTAPLTGCFVINTEVMAVISGSRVTLMCPVIPDASDIPFDNTGTSLVGTNVEAALQEIDTGVQNISNNLKYENITSEISLAASGSSTQSLLTGKTFSNYNMLSIIFYDSEYIRGSVTVSRNAISGRFDVLIPTLYGTTVYPCIMKEASNTSIYLENRTNITLSVIVRGIKVS